MSTTQPTLTNEQLRGEIEELRRLLTFAGLNLEAWQALQTTPNWKVQNRYVPYFQTAISAHFTSMIIAFYCLHETNHDSVNIPGVLRQLRLTTRLPSEKLDELDRKRAEIKHLWVKVSVLRNKVFGHRERGITFGDAFAQANVRPADFQELFNGTASVLNGMTKALFRETHAFNLGAKEAVLSLHEDIERAYPTIKDKH
ncbi:hypothetical protein [Dyella monticola]|uniref:AbiU2 domain-containing protein n=1 Tax=Dyella monticola TaxID=1927958 RepID=UPI001E53E441|nr:hypothetical protein [Dyella monticola]